MGRRFGQHFLRSKDTAQRIVATVELGEGSFVLEIGPGRGALTSVLLGTGARVCAIEHDALLFEYLQQKWGQHPRISLLHDDILRADLHPAELFGQHLQDLQPFYIVANIPYYLTTPLLMKLIPIRANLKRVVLTLQNEIAERIVAQPNTSKKYGSLSVAVQHAFHPRIHFQLPPEAFLPPPKVHSAVLSLLPKKQFMHPELEHSFLQWCKQVFSQRRKQFGNISPAKLQAPATLSSLSLPALPSNWKTLRPEVLSPSQLLNIFVNGLLN